MSSPTVVPTSVRPNRSFPGSVIVTIVCPHCGGTHTHGGPGGDYTGHRGSALRSPGRLLHRQANLMLPATESVGQAPVRVFVAEIGCGSFRIRCAECGQLRGRYFNPVRAEETAANHARYKHNPIFVKKGPSQ